MPTLEWIGKDKVINHHQDVPYKVLKHKYGFEKGEKTENVTNTGNKIIHGDNLEALKSLLPEYEGKIKCIYIDPPYNTGNEKWVYNDNVNHPKIKKWLGEVVGKEGEDLSRHDKWLCMMYPRLKLLHKLLSDDGAIFISIDDNEHANLKLICDEIFGSNNFIANVIWQKKYTQSNDAKYFSSTHDFLIVFAKNIRNFKINLLERTEEQIASYKNPDNDKRGVWMSQPIQVKTPSESYIYEIISPIGNKFLPPKGRSWQFSKARYNELVDDNRIWFGENGQNVPRIKKFLSEVKQGVTPKTIWLYNEVGSNDEAKKEIKNIFSNTTFDSPKPTSLIKRVLQILTDKNSIILDSFAGSGTTAHAVLNLNKEDEGNRKFILIEMEDYTENITAERVKRVIKGYSATEGTGGGFDYYELGEPLFISEDILNENIDIDIIRQYIFYTETKKTLKTENEKNRYFLGSENNADYYFYYEKDEVTVLNYEFIATLQNRAEQYVVYADKCSFSKEELVKMNIIFKKIPRDITRL